MMEGLYAAVLCSMRLRSRHQALGKSVKMLRVWLLSEILRNDGIDESDYGGCCGCSIICVEDL